MIHETWLLLLHSYLYALYGMVLKYSLVLAKNVLKPRSRSKQRVILAVKLWSWSFTSLA